MITNTEQAKETIRRCRRLREAAQPEAVLRNELTSRLRRIFPADENESWINHYTGGSEARTRVGKVGGGTANRFIDNLVGATTIEYESDLRRKAKRTEGLSQVREHVAGLVREGVPATQVRGLLSDTVIWRAFDVGLAAKVVPENCTDDDILLTEVDELDLVAADDVHAGRLIRFLRMHLAREQSRPLGAVTLAIDIGLGSGPHRRSAEKLTALVTNARQTHSSVALATDLWADFVDRLETGAGDFRAVAYGEEAYLLILARLLSANVLAGQALLSTEDELKSILNGSHFRDRYGLENMVERDYFGWLSLPDYIGELTLTAADVQKDLFAYDFSSEIDQDLFGHLMAQLASRSQRKLLGQEPTPAWLARLLAERCIKRLPNGARPRLVDICCGSGTIIIEILKAARERHEWVRFDDLVQAATGFDIDPLAVSISKTTWVAALASEIRSAKSNVVIPIYHADSLFSVTPVASRLPLIDDGAAIPLNLGGVSVGLPAGLVRPERRALFDRLVDWAYDEARATGTTGKAIEVSAEEAAMVVDRAAEALGITLDADLRNAVVSAARSLTNRMMELSADGRNGIWAFILRNTYKPALLTGHFNGIVTNPPWLALSAVANNPYQVELTRRAQLYGLRPQGPSFLHAELGTTHLLHAVDRYLEPGGTIACLLPGTVLNGSHHEPLRQRSFLASARPVALDIGEIWSVEDGTFKYPSVAIHGQKRLTRADEIAEPRAALASSAGLVPTTFTLHSTGSGRTAWVLGEGTAPSPRPIAGMAQMPQQGADLMPRAAVCIEIENQDRQEWRVQTPRRGSRWGFTVKATKALKGASFPGHVASRFVHRMAQSENLLPYLLGDHRAPVAIPAARDRFGIWKIYDETAIRRMGYVQTARRFDSINERLRNTGNGSTLQQRIDERRKLTQQIFATSGHLLLVGAGGKHVCASCLPVAEATSLIVDQTLYWSIVDHTEEAWFYVGLLNSPAMTHVISPFNPKGDFGERHVHTLPFRMMPPFDQASGVHRLIATLTQSTGKHARAAVSKDVYLSDPSRSLPSRRAKLRDRLATETLVQELNSLCARVLQQANDD